LEYQFNGMPAKLELRELMAPMLKENQRGLKEILLATHEIPKEVPHLVMVRRSSRIPSVIAAVEKGIGPCARGRS
jgi:hypothetical protein